MLNSSVFLCYILGPTSTRLHASGLHHSSPSSGKDRAKTSSCRATRLVVHAPVTNQMNSSNRAHSGRKKQTITTENWRLHDPNTRKNPKHEPTNTHRKTSTNTNTHTHTHTEADKQTIGGTGLNPSVS